VIKPEQDLAGTEGVMGADGGGGAGWEMTQTMYSHVNKSIKNKIKFPKKPMYAHVNKRIIKKNAQQPWP
jgi:hypothetical protein